jgi:hypothetical protein
MGCAPGGHKESIKKFIYEFFILLVLEIYSFLICFQL